jgi:hypothetical protein
LGGGSRAKAWLTTQSSLSGPNQKATPKAKAGPSSVISASRAPEQIEHTKGVQMSDLKVTNAERFANQLFRLAVHNARERAQLLEVQRLDPRIEMEEAAANEAATKRLEQWLSETVESITKKNGGVQ